MPPAGRSNRAPACARSRGKRKPEPPAAEAPAWSGAVSAYLNLPRSSDAYVTGIAIANRGA